MKLVTTENLEQMMRDAAKTSRLRTHLNIHEGPADPVQRLFVATRLNSYFRPHRHPQRSEFSIVIRGMYDVLLFDDQGVVTERVTVGPHANVLGFEIPMNTWHTWLPKRDESLFFEVKEGPYDPQTAAEYAPWSPEEGDPQVSRFVNALRKASVGISIV
jgi:cupin fold WbuC family metalloprotein